MQLPWSRIFIAVAAAATPTCVSSLRYPTKSEPTCHVLPGDPDWPSTPSWDALNVTVGGRLIRTVPLAAVCHDPQYDEKACQELRDIWTQATLHYDSSSSVLTTYWGNASCDPFTTQQSPCALGNYVSYAVDVRSAEDVVATIKFARDHNIRFLVRNTGHSFFGRSTGAGAIAAWTHHLKDITHLNWRDETYQGPALKLGAGVQGLDAINAAKKEGLVVVAGYCNSVGLAGGWTQGTGHSPLSTMFGLGADQVLEFDVVTAAGEIVKASRTENSDLYWALSGGGPGTYGVVIAVTIRAYEDLPVGGMGVYIDPTKTTTDNYWTALRKLYSILPTVTDNGMHITMSYNTTLFIISGVTAYNQTSSAVQKTMSPFIGILDSLQIPYQSWLTDSPAYLEHASQYGDVKEATTRWQAGDRLIPRHLLEDEGSPAFADLMMVLRGLYDGGVEAGVSVMAARNRVGADNAVHPAWREATVLLGMLHHWDPAPSAWDDMLAMQRRLTGMLPEFERVTPGSAAYVNEGDPFQENWKEAFFGPNYDRLLAIKDKYDPDGVFYAWKTVGSDRWDVAEDGRMCRV
ncbi:hypothetical protein PG996_014143 [Apiospora saccharicola]|uniref:FAD-binding PCMH-type domain-containing protein n=1 Tax=Apiospora saccharicola TaxID=335842 RepID=A0ABR1THH6_9PEZI